MSFQELMLTYGYPILFVGVMLESEAFLIVAAYLAHRGYFSLPVVIAVAALGSFAVTQLCFFLGQRYGTAFLAKRPNWQHRFSKVQQLMHRHGPGLVLGYRALYGLRGAIPASLGLANYSSLGFLSLNAIGAVVWALVVALAGNKIAETAERMFQLVRQHELVVVSVLFVLGVLWGIHRLYRQPTLKQPVPHTPVDEPAGLVTKP